MTIQDLKALGYDVEVHHLRRIYLKPYGAEYPHYLQANGSKDEEVIPNGGMTVVDIWKGTDCLATGMAVCSKKDNYNKKLGLQLALGRAIYDLDLKGRRRRAAQ